MQRSFEDVPRGSHELSPIEGQAFVSRIERERAARDRRLCNLLRRVILDQVNFSQVLLLLDTFSNPEGTCALFFSFSSLFLKYDKRPKVKHTVVA